MLKRIEEAPVPGDDDFVFTSWYQYQEYRKSLPVDVERIRSLPVIAVEIDGERV